jgi:AmmeMemoRadiSam system protein B
MGWVRKADFAGSWYPRGEREVREEIEGMLRRGFPCPQDMKEPIGGIVPHAGWYYSGRLAASTIRCLSEGKRPDTVVIFGHHLAERYPNIIMPKGAWHTPLGEIPVDSEMGERLIQEFRFQIESEKGYHPDNTIELQLPLIKYFFKDSMILPIGLPPEEGSLKIAERIVAISQELKRSIRVLGSTDLTHYGYNYGFLPAGAGEKAVRWVKEENDKRIVELMVKMDPRAVMREAKERHNACCPGAAASAIEASLQLGAKKAIAIGYYTSYDVLANDSFVGYVGIVFYC